VYAALSSCITTALLLLYCYFTEILERFNACSATGVERWPNAAALLWFTAALLLLETLGQRPVRQQ